MGETGSVLQLLPDHSVELMDDLDEWSAAWDEDRHVMQDEIEGRPSL